MHRPAISWLYRSVFLYTTISASIKNFCKIIEKLGSRKDAAQCATDDETTFEVTSRTGQVSTKKTSYRSRDFDLISGTSSLLTTTALRPNPSGLSEFISVQCLEFS